MNEALTQLVFVLVAFGWLAFFLALFWSGVAIWGWLYGSDSTEYPDIYPSPVGCCQKVAFSDDDREMVESLDSKCSELTHILKSESVTGLVSRVDALEKLFESNDSDAIHVLDRVEKVEGAIARLADRVLLLETPAWVVKPSEQKTRPERWDVAIKPFCSSWSNEITMDGHQVVNEQVQVPDQTTDSVQMAIDGPLPVSFPIDVQPDAIRSWSEYLKDRQVEKD